MPEQNPFKRYPEAWKLNLTRAQLLVASSLAVGCFSIEDIHARGASRLHRHSIIHKPACLVGSSSEVAQRVGGAKHLPLCSWFFRCLFCVQHMSLLSYSRCLFDCSSTHAAHYPVLAITPLYCTLRSTFFSSITVFSQLRIINNSFQLINSLDYGRSRHSPLYKAIGSIHSYWAIVNRNSVRAEI